MIVYQGKILHIFFLFLVVAIEALKLHQQYHSSFDPFNCDYSSKEKYSFSQAQLKRHNYYRTKHGSPILKLSERQTFLAQWWADKLASDQDTDLDLSFSRFGQNLYQSPNNIPQKYKEGEASDFWYKEENVYDYSDPGFSSGTGHFSQMIWKSSRSVGFGYSCIDGKTYVVAQYGPVGNGRRDFKENVRPPIRGRKSWT